MNRLQYIKSGVLCLLAAWPAFCVAAFIPENQRQFTVVTIHVSPRGDDAGDGLQARPFKSLIRAQQAVRSANNGADVTVVLADGVYRLTEPLHSEPLTAGRAVAELCGSNVRMPPR